MFHGTRRRSDRRVRGIQAVRSGARSWARPRAPSPLRRGVHRHAHEITGEKAALKKIKLECEDEGVPGTTLREVSLLKELHHPNVVQCAA